MTLEQASQLRGRQEARIASFIGERDLALLLRCVEVAMPENLTTWKARVWTLGNGSRVGPDLSDIGALRRAVEIERSILEPNDEILPQNRSYRAVSRDGQTISGRLLNQDTFSVQILDSKERLLSIKRSELIEGNFVNESPMPSYRDKLSSAELADLVAYLVSLRGF